MKNYWNSYLLIDPHHKPKYGRIIITFTATVVWVLFWLYLFGELEILERISDPDNLLTNSLIAVACGVIAVAAGLIASLRSSPKP